MKSYDITITLDNEGLPYETTLIEGLIKNNTLGSFLYTVANDVIEERYNIEAGHNQIILQQLISTVGSIFDTVSSMDMNISDITGSLNTHTEVLKMIEQLSPAIKGTNTDALRKVEEEFKADVEVDLNMNLLNGNEVHYDTVELSHDDGLEGDLEVSDGIADIFNFDLDS